jgi:pilin isopeptide linkage protein
VAGETGKTTYKIIVPDGMALQITYKVTVDAVVGEKPDVTNKAYFNYNGLTGDATTVEAGEVITVKKASGATGTSADYPSFQIFKQDQFGNPIAGVTFKLCKVALKSDGTAGDETEVTTKTTDVTGLVTFDYLEDLDGQEAIYCFYETNAPTGYTMSGEKTYFYFIKPDTLNMTDAIGIGYSEKVFEVTNNFSSASLTVPVKKTINGKAQTTTNPFSFTLNVTSTPTGATVYSDQGCTKPVTTATATIKGSGTTSFDTLYFNTVGQYQFTLTEDDLTEEETREGFAKDATEYTITVNVVDDNGLKVKTATYAWIDANGEAQTDDLLGTNAPTFDNTLTLGTVTVKLEATKKLTGDTRLYGIEAGEFNFKVVDEDENVIATGTTKAAEPDSPSITEIEFGDITFGQNDLGTHRLSISEVKGTDSSITYSKVVFMAIVEVKTVTGTSDLTASVRYSTAIKSNLDENGKPIFTNTYKFNASGSLSLTGTKELRLKTADGDKCSLSDSEFNFEVYEGSNKVATGTNDASGKITFTEITYDQQSDIRTHTYTVKEVAGDELFIDYSTVEHTVTVEVVDQKDGTLSATVTAVDGTDVETAADAQDEILFTNIRTYVVPTGIHLEFLPYLLMVVLAGGLGILMIRRRRDRRNHI